MRVGFMFCLTSIFYKDFLFIPSSKCPPTCLFEEFLRTEFLFCDCSNLNGVDSLSTYFSYLYDLVLDLIVGSFSFKKLFTFCFKVDDIYAFFIVARRASIILLFTASL